MILNGKPLIVLEVANEYTSQCFDESDEDESDEDESEDESDEDESSDEDDELEELIEILSHELWRKTMRKNEKKPYYNIDKEYIEPLVRSYLKHQVPPEMEIQDILILNDDDPKGYEYGGFWYKKGLAHSQSLMKFYGKFGFHEDPRVFLEWRCFGDIPFPSMIKSLS